MAAHTARMKNYQHIELITETYPPEINGVALTVQALEYGLRNLGHRVGLVRPEQHDESPRHHQDLMLVEGAPIPRYPGSAFWFASTQTPDRPLDGTATRCHLYRH